MEGIRHTAEVAAKATAGNFTGPLIAGVTFVRPLLLSGFLILIKILDPSPERHLAVALDPPPLLRRRRHPRANPLAIRLDQGRVIATVPIPRDRAPGGRVLVRAPGHRRGRLPRVRRRRRQAARGGPQLARAQARGGRAALRARRRRGRPRGVPARGLPRRAGAVLGGARVRRVAGAAEVQLCGGGVRGGRALCVLL